jgi:hypothetical protein
MVGTAYRTNHQARVDWWRSQFQRQRTANLSIAEFCQRLGVSVTTFYYWRKRIDGAASSVGRQAPAQRPSQRPTTMAPNFVPVSIVEPTTGAELEIELANACVVRLRGSLSPRLLRTAIKAAGQLDGSHQGAI